MISSEPKQTANKKSD